MGELARQLLETALKLPTDERAALAAELMASIDGAPDADAEEAWAAEIERRRQQALHGTAETIDWDIARARIEADLRRK
jgi:putative addiction module component (TIGR02574 family)